MNGFPSHMYPHPQPWQQQQTFGHCMGCRCFQYTTTQTIPAFVTTYQPRHRKPGPAQ